MSENRNEPPADNPPTDQVEAITRKYRSNPVVAVLVILGTLAVGFTAWLANMKSLVKGSPPTTLNQNSGNQSPMISDNRGVVNNVYNVPPLPPPPVKSKNEPPKKELNSAFLDCEIGVIPLKYPDRDLTKQDDGYTHIFALEASEQWRNELMNFFGAPGSPGPWNVKGAAVFGYKCNLINYSSRTLTNIELDITLGFYQALRVQGRPSSFQEGPLTLSRQGRTFISILDPGPDSHFLFYIRNSGSAQFIHVGLPKEITGTFVGDEAVSRIMLGKTPNTLHESLFPAIEN